MTIDWTDVEDIGCDSYQKYFQAYRHGRFVVDLYRCVSLYQLEPSISNLSNLQRVWQKTESSLRQSIEKCGKLNRSAVFCS